MENTQIDKIKTKITPILKEHAVKKAALFGSVARGEGNKHSDLDVPNLDLKGLECYRIEREPAL